MNPWAELPARRAAACPGDSGDTEQGLQRGDGALDGGWAQGFLLRHQKHSKKGGKEAGGLKIKLEERKEKKEKQMTTVTNFNIGAADRIP